MKRPAESSAPRGSALDLRRQMLALEKTLRATPIVPLELEGVSLFAKLEFLNVVGSIKDRPAYEILKCAIARGDLGPETTVVESSSGNFASALAVFCRLLGLAFIPVIDPNISRATRAFLESLCDTVVCVEQRDEAGGYLRTRLAKVRSLEAALPNTFWPNQYANLDGMRAHYELTGAEICAQLADGLDYVFVGVSSAGTISGVSRRVKEAFPRIRVIAVDVVGSAIFGHSSRRRVIPGIGSSMVPELLAHAEIDDVVVVSEDDTIAGCLELLDRHHLLVGGSSGSAYAAVKQYRPLLHRGVRRPRVLFLCCDRGTAYLDTIFNPGWRAWRRGDAAEVRAAAAP